MNSSFLYQIALTQLNEIGSVTAKSLVAYCGSAEAVFKASKKQLQSIPNIGVVRAEAIFSSKNEALKLAEQEIKFIEKNKLTTLFYTDKNYPKRLLQCSDSPPLLYFKGNANLNADKIISIVGTRRITEYGKEQCEKLVAKLAVFNPLIISGLAYGVDIAAHKAAMKNNLQTVGVVANGMDKMYPAQHIKYIKEMVESGGVLTEYRSGRVADKQNFPQRNRIVAGMCDALIVIETAVKGGAMITATLANSYNREVFALPGKVSDEFSAGCNYLIKSNQAILLENVEDLVKSMLWDVDSKNKITTKQTTLFLELNENEKMVVDLFSKTEQMSIDDLVIESNFSPTKLAALLLEMELKGMVKALPGKTFKIIK